MNPSGSLTINLGSGDDVLDVESLAAACADLTIARGSGDTVNLDASFSFTATDGDVSYTISYQGGDGNDLVILASLPPDDDDDGNVPVELESFEVQHGR